MRALNKRFFEKDRPTNVISFSYLEDSLPGEVLGDIIVCVERAQEEARDSAMHFYERLLGLIIHGLVHIMGYDHERGEKESRRMKYREKKLMCFATITVGYRELIDEKA